MKKELISFSVILVLLFAADNIFCGGLNFGPVMGVKQKVKEYQDKEMSPEDEAKGQILTSELNGVYSGKVRLAASNSPYSVTGSVGVNGDLTIDAGVTIKFLGYHTFSVSNGYIIANGTKISPIIFTSGQNNPVAGHYAGVTFGTSRAELNYVKFEYGAGQSISGDSTTKILNCTFAENNSVYPILLITGTVTNCDFDIKNSTSVYIGTGAAPTITYCNIQGAIYSFSAGSFKVNNSNLWRNAAHVVINNSPASIDASVNYWVYWSIDEATTKAYIDANYINKLGGGDINTSKPQSSKFLNAGPQ